MNIIVLKNRLFKVSTAYGPVSTTTLTNGDNSSWNLDKSNSIANQKMSDDVSDDSNSSIYSFSYYYTYSNEFAGAGVSRQHQSEPIAGVLVKSKYESPFLLRRLQNTEKTIRKMECETPVVADSGVSSLSSAQMFFADISEFWHSSSSAASSSGSSRRFRATSSASLPTNACSVNSALFYLTNLLKFVK